MIKHIVFLIGLNLLASYVVRAQSVNQPSGGKAPDSVNRIGTEGIVPGRLMDTNGSRLATTPNLTTFLPDSALATGTAVLIFPKIGLTNQAVDQESKALAARLTARGITVFVLPYRLAQSSLLTPKDSLDALAMALSDGKQALGYLRQHATELGIKPDQIGVLGVSTGGALALQLVYDPTKTNRPNFVSLLWAEVGTLTAELVPADEPALFIAAMLGATSANARQVAIQTAALYQQWLRAGRSVELHSYDLSSQPAGISPSYTTTDAWLDQWTNWLNRQGYLQKRIVTQSNQL